MRNHPYLSFFRMRFIHSLQYRAAALAGICTQFVWGFMEVLMFRAFYNSDPSSIPMAFPQLVSYIWLQQAFLAMFMLWFWEMELFESITSGNVAYELCRPIGLYPMWFTRSVAVRLSKTLLRCMPILLLAVLLPAPYNLTLPPDASAALWGLLSMLLGLLVVVAASMVVYMSVFFTISNQGIRIVISPLGEFLSGAIIPLPFLPEGMRRLVEFLPFASMQNAPLRIYTGNVSGSELYRTLALQVFWLAVLVAVGVLMERRAMKKVVIQGG